MNRVVALLLLSSVLGGCDALDSQEDAKVKEELLGSWYSEHKDPSERIVKTVVTLEKSGSFSARERVAGEPREERSSGSWYVTDSLLKLQSNEIDGKKLGTREITFFTCKVVDLTAKGFSCVQGDDNRKFTFRRVQSDFALS